ncbi:MAG: hypothetical protein KKF12_19330 [Proteobacteria bacterium]|nr:hypothetical protein [Pseudomonadota bacterium]
MKSKNKVILVVLLFFIASSTLAVSQNELPVKEIMIKHFGQQVFQDQRSKRNLWTGDFNGDGIKDIFILSRGNGLMKNLKKYIKVTSVTKRNELIVNQEFGVLSIIHATGAQEPFFESKEVFLIVDITTRNGDWFNVVTNSKENSEILNSGNCAGAAIAISSPGPTDYICWNGKKYEWFYLSDDIP